MYSNEDRLKQIKDAGQAIIDNAESIMGNEQFRTGLTIHVEFPLHDIPTITVERSFIPDRVVMGA